jgi:prophage antirepressor-like protein
MLKVYANRWKFKHPTQKTSLEQWKMHLLLILIGSLEGWFYSTDFVDIGIKEVKQYISETYKRIKRRYKVRKGRFGLDKGHLFSCREQCRVKIKSKESTENRGCEIAFRLCKYLTAEEKGSLKSRNTSMK